MKLRRVDILGFKSFRAKTGLDIADGVTVVVGPNGCGKSNIVDAIRWAIGSQSAKDLRGRAMEDVIFAGSANHRPLGVAEVSLTFETNERSDVPAAWRDHAEIRITRRLFRTGESEYEINRQRVRLRDIHELFLGTGVGAKEAYSIVEQGRIGFIVSSRPQERRVIIEEAAGVTRYKYQRRTAQRRLERTRENLHRVRDVLDEVARQVASLERQAKRARKYRELNERLTYLRAVVAFRRLERAAEAARVAGAERATRRAKVEETEGRLRAAEARVSEAALTTASAEQAWNEATEQHFRARSRVDLLENNVVHQRREREALDERAEGLAASIEALAEAHIRHRAETERLAEEVEQRSAAATAHAEEVSELRTQLEAAREAASAQAAATETHARRIATRRGDAASAAARAEAAREEQARLGQAEETLAEEVSGARDALSLARTAHAACTSALDAARAEREQAEATLEASTAAERAAREALTAARQAAEAASREAARAETRFRTLDAAWRRGQGYEAATREALAAAEQWSGKGRPLAERLEIAPHAEASSRWRSVPGSTPSSSKETPSATRCSTGRSRSVARSG